MKELELYQGDDKKYYIVTPTPCWHKFDTKEEALAFVEGWRNASMETIKLTDQTPNLDA